MFGLLLRRNNVVYSVHERPDYAADVQKRASELVFVSDGFSWGAAIVPPLALIYRLDWLAALVYLALAAMIFAGLDVLDARYGAYALSVFALGLIFGFEAANFRRWSLDALGWTEIATVSGADAEECELRFFSSWRPDAPQPSGDDAEAFENEIYQENEQLRRLFAEAC